jgi:hypothetical protein
MAPPSSPPASSPVATPPHRPRGTPSPHGSQPHSSPTGLAAGEALNLCYDGSPEVFSSGSSSVPRCDESPMDSSALRLDGSPLDSLGNVARSSTFKEALLRPPRSFKPRFPTDAPHDSQVWYDERSMRRPSVWSRLQHCGPLSGRLANRIHGGPSDSASWLEHLRAKAGTKYFNCLSAGHRIASYRDPPR